MRMTPIEPATKAPPWNGESSNPIPESLVDSRARQPEDLVRLFSGDIWRYVASQVSRKEDAEDITMEVFAAAFSDFAKIQRADDQKVWLLSIARRKVADTLRKRYRRKEQSFSSLNDTASLPMFTEVQLATRGALEQLPENQREVLILKYINGLSTEEVGSVIRQSIAATNSLLQRSRESLRKALGPQVLGHTGETV